MNQIGVESLIRTRLRMGDRKLHVKGIFFALGEIKVHEFSDLNSTDDIPSMFLPYFFPLAGLSGSNIRNILHDYETNLSDFSFQRSWLSSISGPQESFTGQKRRTNLLEEGHLTRSNLISAFRHSTGKISGQSIEEIFSHLHLEWIQGKILTLRSDN